MFKVTTIFERPSSDVPYYMETQPTLREDFNNFYPADNDILVLNVNNESPTRQVSEAFYQDEQTYNAFMAKFNARFPTFFQDRDSYHESVGVVTTKTTAEV